MAKPGKCWGLVLELNLRDGILQSNDMKFWFGIFLFFKNVVQKSASLLDQHLLPEITPPFHQELVQNDNVIQTAQGPVGYNRSCWPDNCGPGRGPWQDRQAALPPGVTTRRFKASTKCSNFFFWGGPKVSTLHQIVAKTSPGICGHPIYVL